MNRRRCRRQRCRRQRWRWCRRWRWRWRWRWCRRWRWRRRGCVVVVIVAFAVIRAARHLYRGARRGAVGSIDGNQRVGFRLSGRDVLRSALRHSNAIEVHVSRVAARPRQSRRLSGADRRRICRQARLHVRVLGVIVQDAVHGSDSRSLARTGWRMALTRRQTERRYRHEC